MEMWSYPEMQIFPACSQDAPSTGGDGDTLPRATDRTPYALAVSGMAHPHGLDLLA